MKGYKLNISTEMFSKWESRSLHILGNVLFVVSLLLIPSTILAAARGEPLTPFIWPMAIGLVLSIFLTLLFRNPKDMRPADGLLMMCILWFALFLFGVLPYLLSGMNVVDSLFESVSGFSTTGATIMTNIEAAPLSLLLWRAMTHWIGGIIIVIMFMFIIPMVVVGGRGLLKNEMSGSGKSNMYVKLGDAAKQFIAVYVSLTALFAVILVIMGVSVMDAVTIGMSTISTGGFMNTNDSIDGFAWYVKVAITVFMMLSATNFYMHYRAVVKKEINGYRKSEEFRVMIAWILTMSVFVCILMYAGGVWDQTGDSGFENAVDVLFTVTAISSTTGFTTMDYTTQWPIMGVSLLIMLMFIGGSSGSTAGGIKMSRAIVVFKAMVNEIRQTFHPNSVYSVKFDKEGLNEGAVHAAMVVVIMFTITALVGTAVFDTFMTSEESLFSTVSFMTGTGPGAGAYFSGFASMPDWAKVFACAIMFLGRMEIVSALVLIMPGFWKEVYGPGYTKTIRDKLKSVKEGGINHNIPRETPKAPVDTPITDNEENDVDPSSDDHTQ